jgi:hypothetical protein
MNITREQAICMFFCKEFNEENIKTLVKRIDDMKDIDVCYRDDPTDPVLVSNSMINGYPFKYNRYNPSLSARIHSEKTILRTNKEQNN